MATKDRLLEIEGSHIRIENLKFTGSNEHTIYSRQGEAKNIQIVQCDIQYAGLNALTILGVQDLLIEGCNIENTNNNAIAINYDCDNARVLGNNILNTGMQEGMGRNGDGQYIGLVGRNNGMVVEGNVFQNVGYLGIDFGGNNVSIKNNYINTFCAVKGDGGGIYTYNGSDNRTYSNRNVIGNIVINGIGAPYGTNSPRFRPAEGIYLDDNTNHVNLEGNTIANCGQSGIFLHNARDIVIKGNTLYNCKMQLFTKHDNLGNPISGIEATDNVFFSKESIQLTASFISSKNDIGNIGTFDYNYYVRPMNDELTIKNEFYRSGDIRQKNNFELVDWQSTFGFDQNSRTSPVEIEEYEIVSIEGANQVITGAFDDSWVPGTWCFSPYSDCNVTWDRNSSLGEGVAKVVTDSEAAFGIEAGLVDEDKNYILRFTAAAEYGDVALNIVLRQLDRPWADLSLPKSVKVTREPKTYEVLIPHPISDPSCGVMFQSSGVDQSYWIDNISLEEAKVTMKDPDSYYQLLTNPTTAEQTFQLEGDYIDVRKKNYSGEVTLAPYQSIVLINTSGENVKVSGALIRFRANTDGCLIRLDWALDDEEAFHHYELERSFDGRQFRTIAEFTPGENDGKAIYTYEDMPGEKEVAYRLKMVDNKGRASYSDAVFRALDCANLNEGYWEMAPNLISPEVDKQVTLTIGPNMKEKLHFELIDPMGRLVRQWSFLGNEETQTVRVDVSGLVSGWYILHTNDIGGAAQRLLIAGNHK